MVLITFWASLKNSYAREAFKFDLGEQLQVLSDKAFRKTKEKKFEAIGNVIITHFNNAVYGQKASVSFETGDIEVVGNVRYVGPAMTVYGTQLKFNFKTQFLQIDNARIRGENYTVLGKKIIRLDRTNIIAYDAEYTTCRDCPESWSIFGRKLHITLGQYVRINNAYFKSRGVTFFYFPYIVFPIKKKRETGLLFPSFGLDLEEGFRFRQPWFWAMSDINDMTISPSIYGKRGWGNELQFRQMFGDKKWLELNSLGAADRIFQPGKYTYDESNHHFLRHFSVLESHFQIGNNINSHFYINETRDLDAIRDFSFFTEDHIEGSELLRSGHIDWRTDYTLLSSQAYYNKNYLISDQKEFDDSLVQILPKNKLSITPITLFNSRYFPIQNLSFNFDADHTIFKQNHIVEGTFIRNAQRANIKPEIKWNLGMMGPLFLGTKSYLDLQTYHFPYEEQKSFTKSGIVYETELSTQIFKIFGLSYVQSIPESEIDFSKTKFKKDEEEKESITYPNIVGSLEDFNPNFANKKYEIIKNSYKHTQDIKIKHYFITDQRTRGNQSFLNQIKDEKGLFDYLDALRDQENKFGHLTSKTRLPLRNTIELQWNNTLVKKSPQNADPRVDKRFLRQNFTYSQVGQFNISQGLDLDSKEEDLKDRLTRLLVNGSISANQYSFSFTEYYFYSENGHILNLSGSRSFDRFSLGMSAAYDSFSTPVNKTFSVNGSVSPNDLVTLNADYRYDWEKRQSTESNYGLTYKPKNNCWMIDAKYTKSQIEKKYSVNILINFNENSFTSLTGI